MKIDNIKKLVVLQRSAFSILILFSILYLTIYFSIPYRKLAQVGFEPTTSCFPYRHSNHWAIWLNDEMCLMVYRIKWSWSSSHCYVIATAKFRSHLQLTFYISSTSTLRANFRLGPSSIATLTFRIYFLRERNYIQSWTGINWYRCGTLHTISTSFT